ncbi:pentapeptide repeat-containing protein [Nocardia fluminea]|uniref:pentapeptide repeat-containing protein n=1 Tax=Nocardia fluminea TaxID=134984 RepID=UPI00365E8167
MGAHGRPILRVRHSARRAASWFRGWPLLPSVLLTLTVCTSIAVAAWMLLGRYVFQHQWPWRMHQDAIQNLDLTKLALTIAAGIGAVVTLTVAYRRQRDVEQGRFIERFGAAAKQLGDPAVAVRLAAVYAMVGVADESTGLRRQQCVDVLCGYLRLPYDPEIGGNHQSKLVLKHHRGTTDGTRADDQEQHLDFRQNDRQVRQTIVRVIAEHLQTNAETSWSHCDFDFRGAVLEAANLRGARFSGTRTSFGGATFIGRTTTFRKATFNGEFTSFHEATFSSENTLFSLATFSGENTLFSLATFSGENTTFDKAKFSSKNTSFDETMFSSKNTSFRKATFSGENTTFDEATSSSKKTLFSRATFSGETTSFDEAKFSSKNNAFDETMFSSENTSFRKVTFSGENTLFRKATFSGENTAFDEATFSGEITSFREATFSAENTSFREATFSGTIRFISTDFGSKQVSFAAPRQWGTPPPEFDWGDDGVGKPVNVEPQNWPPVATSRNSRHR